MKKIFLSFLILGILFTNNAYPASYKTGDIVIDEFNVTKKYKVEIPGEWVVMYTNNWVKYGFTTNFYGLAKVQNNELLEYTFIFEDRLAGMYVGWVDGWINQVQFKGKYDGCYERPEYFLTEVIKVGSAHNCFQIGHVDIYRELYTPDDPHHGRAGVARFKNWIEDNNIKYSKIMLWSYHSYFSRMVDGNWISVGRGVNPKIYNAPKSNYLSEETSEYHKFNIDNFPKHKKMMAKWLSISAERHIEFENNARAKSRHKLDLSKYITHTTIKNNDSNTNIVEKIKGLKELLDAGAITKEEFEKAKKKLLN